MTKNYDLHTLETKFQHLDAIAMLQRPSAYAPLYHEPTPGSGERICIGVAAKCGDETAVYIMDELVIHQFISGNGVDWLRLLIQSAAQELRDFIGRNGFERICDWPPACRITVGPIKVCSLLTIESVIDIGLTASSSLYSHTQAGLVQQMR